MQTLGRWLTPHPPGIAGGSNLRGFNGAPTVEVDPWGLACEKYKTKSMRKGMKKFDQDSGVEYLNRMERQRFRVTIKDGKMYGASGRPFDTSSADSLHSGPGVAIFVMDGEGGIFVSNRQRYREFHHSSLLSVLPVAAAGEVEVRNGAIAFVSDNSGHYHPRPEHQQQFLNELREGGVDTSSIYVETNGD